MEILPSPFRSSMVKSSTGFQFASSSALSLPSPFASKRLKSSRLLADSRVLLSRASSSLISLTLAIAAPSATAVATVVAAISLACSSGSPASLAACTVASAATTATSFSSSPRTAAALPAADPAATTARLAAFGGGRSRESATFFVAFAAARSTCGCSRPAPWAIFSAVQPAAVADKTFFTSLDKPFTRSAKFGMSPFSAPSVAAVSRRSSLAAGFAFFSAASMTVRKVLAASSAASCVFRKNTFCDLAAAPAAA
mmetsp:Transcript_29962/g.70591  ORF Transcript_29962/g.70591 Transcript_29962/m.70591 type:complete len:255 (-) Transcript_29962:1628-2392(-)